MPASPKTLLSDLTPQGRLTEGPLLGLLGYQLVQAELVTMATYTSTVGLPCGLHPVEFTILHLVNQNPDITPTRLAHALAITTPGMTVWLGKLAARKLVTRQRSKADGRSHHLRLTPEGRSLAQLAMQQLLAAEDQLLAPLTAGERTLLLELVHKVSRLRGSSVT